TVKQKDVKNDFSYYFSQIFSQLKNLKNLKIFSLYNYYGISLFDSYNKYIYSLKKFKIFSFRLTSGDTLLAFFAQIVIFIFGGVSVINGNMTIGIFSVLLSYFNMMLNSIKYIPSLTSSYAEMFASYSRITELINLEKDNTGKLKYSDNNFLEIKNLTYKYPGSNTYLFSKFNYSFQKGNIYCLKGRNGSGKTTLLDIISKLKFSYNGSIELNQRNIELFDTKYYRDVCLSYMTQDAFVIKAGLKDNILSQNLSEKLSTLIQELGLEKYIDSNYNINTKISGGEKQKISFLRSITKPFNILLLDEPTNHLDFISKEILMKYLNNIKNDAIIIISSHDNFVLERVDTIIDLNKS
ncbi:ABC transporter ATP-binding protein, partial [Enterococcus faecalis]|nr:ABC transporter ATP-binding protein [Enterococcus faecalis]ELZ4692846.1 ABC transporter ATP-binding protein [Enterococcus faecalis]